MQCLHINIVFLFSTEVLAQHFMLLLSELELHRRNGPRQSKEIEKRNNNTGAKRYRGVAVAVERMPILVVLHPATPINQISAVNQITPFSATYFFCLLCSR